MPSRTLASVRYFAASCKNAPSAHDTLYTLVALGGCAAVYRRARLPGAICGALHPGTCWLGVAADRRLSPDTAGARCCCDPRALCACNAAAVLARCSADTLG